MRLYFILLLGLLRRVLRSRDDLLMENLVLRQQLAVYARRPKRPRLQDADRLFWSAVARTWGPWRSHLQLVRPETVIGWHRTAWRRYWSWRSRGRRPGRPRIDPELRELIVRLARENPRWGVVRIVGELRALGFAVSARTVRRYRTEALRRPPSQTWSTFLKNHAPDIWAVDLFTVQTLMLQTLYVIVFIGHGRRRIMHFNVTRHPTASWVWRQLLEATPWGEQPRHLIRDRDRCYGTDFIARASRIGIHTILTPVHAPNANAVAERVIGTLRRECLDHLIVLNERHLLHVLHEYTVHYNAKRPHRTLVLDSPEGREPQPKPGATATVVSRPVLGGLHHEYEWAAA
jgi:hypothetical protein